MTDYLEIAQDIMYPSHATKEEITPEEAYDWLLFCLVEDFKQALDYVPMEQLITDLEKRGISTPKIGKEMNEEMNDDN